MFSTQPSTRAPTARSELAACRAWVVVVRPHLDTTTVPSTVDGTVLVSRCGKTTTTQARQAANSLTVVGARLLGCVLNMTPTRSADAYTYYEYSGSGQRPRRTATPAPAAPPKPAAIPVERVSTR